MTDRKADTYKLMKKWLMTEPIVHVVRTTTQPSGSMQSTFLKRSCQEPCLHQSALELRLVVE